MRKGITPVVAIILLLLMTIAAAGAAYLWITKLQGILAESAQGSWVDTQRKTNSKISIESIYNDTNGHLYLVLRNVGTYDFTTSDQSKITLYIDEQLKTQRSSTGASDLPTTSPAVNCLLWSGSTASTFSEGATMSVNCTSAYGSDPTKTVIVKIEPPFGSGDVKTYRSGGSV